MKLVRYGRSGKEKPGLVDSSGRLRDLSEVVADIDADTLGPRALSRLAKLKPESLPAVRGTPRIGPCVAKVGNFIAVGLNYADHAAESGLAVPKEPILFNKAPSCIVGPNDDVVIPKGSKKTDWEVELAIVIGTRASYVSEADALRHVAGYCICNDVSEREFQTERGGPVDEGQGLPDLRPARSLAGHARRDRRPAEARHVARRQRRADAERLDRDHDLRRRPLVSYISQFMILEPGDVITTGTPPGVGMGMKPPRFLKAGDTHVARHRRARPAGAAGGRLQGRVSRTPVPMRLLSWTGVALAGLYALVFAGLYLDYLRRAGTWFADLPLVLAALPFTLAMREANGGSYDFSGDMTLRVVAAAAFCCALAYIAGWIVEAAIRGIVRIARTG